MKLNIGAGMRHIEGFISVDKYVQEGNFVCDTTDLPYENGIIEEIYSSHVLEHLSFDEVPQALNEWYRVLKNKGKVTVVVPNFDWIAAAWLHGGDRNYAKQILFGSQVHEGEFHKNGWGVKELEEEFERAGFEVIGHLIQYTPEYSQESIIMEARKWEKKRAKRKSKS